MIVQTSFLRAEVAASAAGTAVATRAAQVTAASSTLVRGMTVESSQAPLKSSSARRPVGGQLAALAELHLPAGVGAVAAHRRRPCRRRRTAGRRPARPSGCRRRSWRSRGRRRRPSSRARCRRGAAPRSRRHWCRARTTAAAAMSRTRCRPSGSRPSRDDPQPSPPRPRRPNAPTFRSTSTLPPMDLAGHGRHQLVVPRTAVGRDARTLQQRRDREQVAASPADQLQSADRRAHRR